MKLLLIFSMLMFSISSFAKTIELTQSNVLIYNAPVTRESAYAAQKILENLVAKRGKKDYPLYVLLDCPGGEIYSGEQFIQYAKMVPNVHTITIFAASMCSAIVEGLPGKRYITENGIMMFHRAQGRFEGYFEDGEVEAQLALWKQIVRGMELRNANRMCITLEEYKKKVITEFWLYGTESVKAKASDETVDIVCSKELRASGDCPLQR